MKWSFFSVVTLFFLISPRQSHAQVNPQNGAAEITIPLYSYSDPGNRLSLNASLVYVDGNGLKVSEMASCVGTGWVLDCGGSITRIQHGEPDDQKFPGTFDYDNNYFGYSLNYYPDGYLYTSYLPTDVIDNGGSYVPYKIATSSPNFKMQPQYLADREQDVFAFSFNGRSGQFVIGKNKTVRTLIDSKLKIDFQESDMSGSGIRTRISQFTITDESGIQYVFKDTKQTFVCKYNDCRNAGVPGDANRVTDLTQIAPSPVPLTGLTSSGYYNSVTQVIMGTSTTESVIDKWYLSQIINPLTNKKITFTYTDFNESLLTDKQVTYAPISGDGTVNFLWQRYTTRDKRISSVDFGGFDKLDMIYSSSPRKDLKDENTLDQIKISYNNTPVYSWNFGYGYFVQQAIKAPADIASNSVDEQYARLCLQTLQKNAPNNSNEPPYRFTYNLGGDNNVYNGQTYTVNSDVIPPMFSLYQDHYGYYNGSLLASSTPESALTSFYTNTRLKMLLTPVSGVDAYKQPVIVPVPKNGIIKSITYPLGGSLTYAYELNGASPNQLGGVRVKTTSLYDGIDHAKDIVKQYNYIKADGTSSLWGGETYKYHSSKTIIASTCQPNQTPAYAVKDFAATFVRDAAQHYMTPTTGAASLTNATLSSALANVGVFVAATVIMAILSSGNTTTNYSINEYTLSSTVAGNSLPWGYMRTEVVSLLSSDNIGKVVYDFSSPYGTEDHPIELTTLAFDNSNKPRFASWAYGLPNAVTIFDKTPKLIKKTTYHYDYFVNPFNDANFLSRSWSPNTNHYGCILKFSAGGSNSYIDQEQYYPLVGRTELKSTDETTYNTAQQYTTVTTVYKYNSNYQLKSKSFVNSKGDSIISLSYYPYDYFTATGTIATMNSTAHISSPVVSTETYIRKSDGTKYLISGNNMDFDVYSNGDIKPKVSYSFQNALPLISSTLAPFSTASVLRDPSYFKQTALFDYDNYGNLVQTVTGGNKVGSNIYDYNGKLVVAAVSNASYTDIAYSSFEAEGGKAGSWLNSAAIVSDDARTGNKSFNLSDPTNSANNYFGFGGLNTSLTYIVSFWSKNGSSCLLGNAGTTTVINTCQGTSGWKQGATINGWTYYERQVTGIDKITCNGTGLVDEFRLYPVGAQMTTTTYNPLVGKTSECDASGRVTYYTYDDMGRLIKVSDDQRNTIKTYEYNYKQ